ncbi:MAG TPA: hypothetical protein VD884_05090 [Ohtaekwangia sp.]|nr:hypothetical protein [Ohtaekwangia sp.]
MKSFIVRLVFLLNLSSPIFAQQTTRVFQEDTPITWLGLDFSEAKFIGDTERFTTDEDVFKLMYALNVLMINEAEKYDIGKAFKKNNVTHKLDVTIEHNKGLDAQSVVSTDLKDVKRLTPDDIQDIVAGYDFNTLKGLGLMFNVEAFSKSHNKGSIFITFIDMENKQVVLTERFTASPKGFGLRNYWAGAVYTMLKSLKSIDYRTMRKKYTKL